MIKNKTWLIVLLIITMACFGFYRYLTNKSIAPAEIIHGSPCSYDTFYIPAKVVQADTSLGEQMMVNVSVQKDEHTTDTFDIRREPPYRMISKRAYLASGIRVGDSILCTLYKIKSGSCSPAVHWFKWERYTDVNKKAFPAKPKTIVPAGPSY